MRSQETSRFGDKMDFLSNRSKTEGIVLLGMPWKKLNNNLSNGYYYRADPYSIKRWGLIQKIGSGSEYEDFLVTEVPWQYIEDNAIGGARVYYDENVSRIWMFWGSSLRTLHITTYDGGPLGGVLRMIEILKALSKQNEVY